MAKTNWARVYLHDVYAGVLQQNVDGSTSFTYDSSYKGAPLSVNLPLQKEPHHYPNGLHPFFDNLVAEGWLAKAQARSLGISEDDKFKLLIAFGYDCIGAVTIIDPDPDYKVNLGFGTEQIIKAVASRASMSGVQPKMVLSKRAGKYYPAKCGELSTHIAKFESRAFPNIIDNEYITSLAARILLDPDPVAKLEIANIEELNERALVVTRFDRQDGRKMHFEEFNQLLMYKSEDKYHGSYEEMARFITNSQLCISTDLDKLLRRVLVCILLGNIDAHLKNFAMLYTSSGLRLAPAYDTVFGVHYGFNDLALSFAGIDQINCKAIKAKHLIDFTERCGLKLESLILALEEIGSRIDRACTAINQEKQVDLNIRAKLVDHIHKRWNGICKHVLTGEK